jgi:hypothetical protein
MGGGATVEDDVGEIIRDGAKEPGADDTVHEHPILGVGRDIIRGDMALQQELPGGKKERFWA